MGVPQSFQVFVVSLDRATQRRAHMKKLLDDVGFEATFVSAVDGRSLRPDQRARYDGSRARQVYGCDMTDNEIACYLSHISVYERMLEEKVETALVLEDDISCVPDLRAVVEKVLSLPRASWQVIRLQSTKSSVSRPTCELTRGSPVAAAGDREIVRLRTGVLGGCAYLIQLSAAAAMLARSQRIVMPIDQTLDRYWENGIVPYIVRPLPVWHEDIFVSEIGPRGRQVHRVRHSTLIRRRLQRIKDSANKRIFWLAFHIPSLGALMASLGVPSARMAMRALWGPSALQES